MYMNYGGHKLKYKRNHLTNLTYISFIINQLQTFKKCKSDISSISHSKSILYKDFPEWDSGSQLPATGGL